MNKRCYSLGTIALAFAVILGACAGKEVPMNTESPKVPAVVTETQSVSMDPLTWTEDKSIAGLTFSYPPELEFQAGGDTDGWSAGAVQSKDGARPYFRVVTYTLYKCRYEDPNQCDITTTVPATPGEVFESIVNDAKRNEFYAAGDIILKNGKGTKFIYKDKNAKGRPGDMVLLYGSKGTYKIENADTTGANDALFELFLKTLKVQ